MMALRYSYLTSAEKTANDCETDTTHEFLKKAAKTIGLNVVKETKTYMEGTSKRASDPVNEFTDGGMAFVGAWPDILLLGKAFEKNRSVSDDDTRHLLLQFTCAAASCQLLLFYLFDRMQRHSTIRAMSAKVNQDPKAFEIFTKTFMSSSFQEQLRQAVANPKGKESKSVLRKLVHVMTTGSKKTVFLAMERRSAAGEILAMGRKYGGAAEFLTVSIAILCVSLEYIL